MTGSVDSLDFCPEMPFTEKNAIPLDCWRDINFSDIWIPSHLLTNRSKSSSMKVHHGIYHTLEKKDCSKYDKSFSVYYPPDSSENEQEIFFSDSDDDIFGSNSSRVNHGVTETCGFEDKLNKNTDSVSLKDILDDTPETNIKDAVFDFKKKDDPFLLSLYDKKEKKVKKNKKDKGKKKTYLVLDNFLYPDTHLSQDYYCNKYLQSILNEKQKDASCFDEEFPHLASNEHMLTQSDRRKNEASCSNVHAGSNMEFPQSDRRINEASCSNVHVGSNMEFSYLVSDEHMFTESDKREKENIESTVSDLECGLIESEEINGNIEPYTTDAICGKIVIENIPHDATKDDILAILCGYGEVEKFSLVSTGNFFTAYVEIGLTCDIDWIIECLNGSEPFGASTEKIYCYKQ